jgi:hypothetical protein
MRPDLSELRPGEDELAELQLFSSLAAVISSPTRAGGPSLA